MRLGVAGRLLGILFSVLVALAATTGPVALGQAGLPQARDTHVAVWDSTSAQMVAFGGEDSSRRDLNDLWAYRPATNTWTQLTPASSPVGRDWHTAVWDATNAQMLVFGGEDGLGHNLNDLWAYRPASNAWVQLMAPNPPSVRNSHTAVWDSANTQMLVFAGFGGTSALNDLWAYRPGSNAWTQLAPTAGVVPTSTPTAVATATPYPQPNTGVAVSPTGDGRLQVTVTARDAGCASDNRLISLNFGPTTNALVDLPGGPSGQAGSFTYTVPRAQSQLTFYVRRAAAGQAATVNLTVVDGCGSWPTLVGGGPNVF